MNERHGFTEHPIYTTWRAMRRRCLNPNATQWKHYGGKGVGICAEWADFRTFMAWALVSGWEPGLTIERADTAGDYCPSNCSWASRLQQSNNRSAPIMLEIGGKTQSLHKWVEHYGLRYTTVYKRYRQGKRGKELFGSPSQEKSHPRELRVRPG